MDKVTKEEAMKVCERCGKEIDGKDGDNLCMVCDIDGDGSGKRAHARDRARARREREAVMRDMGMVKVRGALGGTYWE